MNKVCHLPVQLRSVPCSFFILLCVLGLTLAKRHLPGSLANRLPVILGQWEELVSDQRVGARVLLPLPTLIFCCHPGQCLSHPCGTRPWGQALALCPSSCGQPPPACGSSAPPRSWLLASRVPLGPKDVAASCCYLPLSCPLIP